MSLAILLTGCTGLARRDPGFSRGPAPPPSPAGSDQSTIGPDDELLEALRGGGYVLLMRDGAAPPPPDASAPAACDAEATLAGTAGADPHALGLGIRRMRIPVGQALASPDCGARDTASVAFGRAEVAGALAAPPAAEPQRAAAARDFRALRGAVPSEGTNTVLVTHPATVSTMAGTDLAVGEALVFLPLGDGSAELVRRIQLDDLVGLSRARPVTDPPYARGVTVREFPLPPGTRPYEAVVYPHTGIVWFTAEGAGAVGRLDPRTGQSTLFPLGPGSAPRGLAVGPRGELWVADSGLDAIVRVDSVTGEASPVALPAASAGADLTTVRFDAAGTLWFTGRGGVVGTLDVAGGQVRALDVPGGATPDGLAITPGGEVLYASPADGSVGRIAAPDGDVEVLAPPTPSSGIRQAAANQPPGRVWFTEGSAGRIASLEVASGAWSEWRLPGDTPEPAGLYVDRSGEVWVTDLSANALLRFDPVGERFAVVELPTADSRVHTLTGSGQNEIWGAASSADRLLQIQFTPVAPA